MAGPVGEQDGVEDRHGRGQAGRLPARRRGEGTPFSRAAGGAQDPHGGAEDGPAAAADGRPADPHGAGDPGRADGERARRLRPHDLAQGERLRSHAGGAVLGRSSAAAGA